MSFDVNKHNAETLDDKFMQILDETRDIKNAFEPRSFNRRDVVRRSKEVQNGYQNPKGWPTRALAPRRARGLRSKGFGAQLRKMKNRAISSRSHSFQPKNSLSFSSESTAKTAMTSFSGENKQSGFNMKKTVLALRNRLKVKMMPKWSLLSHF